MPVLWLWYGKPVGKHCAHQSPETGIPGKVGTLNLTLQQNAVLLHDPCILFDLLLVPALAQKVTKNLNP